MISDQVLPKLTRDFPGLIVDVVTCWAGEPQGFQHGQATVYRIGEFRGPEGRTRLLHLLQAGGHETAAMICSNEPIMTKWKWMIALRLPVKVLIVNENADFFWLDYTNSRTIWEFVSYRSGMSGANASSTLGRLLLFPFTLVYLILFAAAAHTRRRLYLLRRRKHA